MLSVTPLVLGGNKKLCPSPSSQECFLLFLCWFLIFKGISKSCGSTPETNKLLRLVPRYQGVESDSIYLSAAVAADGGMIKKMARAIESLSNANFSQASFVDVLI